MINAGLTMQKINAMHLAALLGNCTSFILPDLSFFLNLNVCVHAILCSRSGNNELGGAAQN
jgi:hypothetical protein